jgi:hypothetical protein
MKLDPSLGQLVSPAFGSNLIWFTTLSAHINLVI